MEQKLSSQELALYRVVDEVLHYIWDPIGVSGAPQARDEYHGYLLQVFGLLQRGAEASAIANYLSQSVVERMGLAGNAERDLEVANILIDWKDVIREQQV